MRSLITALLGSILSLVLGVSAAAQNPRVSLKLDNVTGTQAVEALGKAAGVPVEVQVPASGEDALKVRASFDWTETTFAKALRQFCHRYRLWPERWQSGSYTLRPVVAAQAAPKRIGLVEHNTGRVFVRSVRFSGEQAVNVGGRAVPPANFRMVVALGGAFAEHAGPAFAGIANAAAKDDRGNLLRWDEEPDLRTGGFTAPGFLFPDDWAGYLNLPPPHPAATRLRWLEGDVLVYRTFRVRRLEVPIPVDADRRQARDGEFWAELSRFDAAPPDGPGAAAGVPAGGATVFGVARVPAEAGTAPDVPQILLRGVSGRLYDQASAGRAAGRRDGMTLLYALNRTFMPIEEPVAAVVFQVAERAQAEKLCSFRIENIPLPTPPAFAPDRPLRQQGGGVLVHRVVIGGKPAGEGWLSVGLARREADGWGGTRWLELDTNDRGEARLPDIKPGACRLLRVFRTKSDLGVRSEGRWQNAELTIEVEAGAETAPPPLAWTAVTRPTPKPSAKLAPRAPARRR